MLGLLAVELRFQQLRSVLGVDLLDPVHGPVHDAWLERFQLQGLLERHVEPCRIQLFK